MRGNKLTLDKERTDKVLHQIGEMLTSSTTFLHMKEMSLRLSHNVARKLGSRNTANIAPDESTAHTGSMTFVEEAKSQLRRFYGEGVEFDIRQEVLTDGSNHTILAVLIPPALDPKEAFERLDKFGDEWWLARCADHLDTTITLRDLH